MLESSLSRRGDRRRRRAIPALLGRFLEDRPRTEVLWLVGIVALSTVLRIAWVVYAARKPVGLHDPGLYLLYGEQIAKGNGYSLLNGEPTAYYPAGYPAALGAVLWAVRQTPLPYDPPIIACLFNVVLGAGTVVLVYALGRRLFEARVGLIAAGLVAAFPNLVFHSAAYLSETLFNFLALAALAVLLLGARDPCQASLRRFAAFGLVLGLATLVRPISLLFLPAVAIGCLIAGPGGAEPSSRSCRRWP